MSSATSHSPDQTQRLGAKLARQLQPQDVLALNGEIGAGKTTFVQGIARGLKVPANTVASPSFVLVKEYQGRLPMYHADLFRLEHLSEAVSVGLEEYYESNGVTVIEWASHIPGVLPDQFLEVQLTVVDPETRTITLIPHGSRYEGRAWFK